MRTKVRLVFIAVFFLNTAVIYPGEFVSGLLQYGHNIDRQRLELLESRQKIHINNNNSHSVTGIYTIRNNGGEYQARFGILLEAWHMRASENVSDVRFFVNGTLVRHTEPIDFLGVFVMDGIEHERKEYQTSFAWALINVMFPENSISTIEVRYTRFNWTINYNTLESALSRFPDLDHWGGSPAKFSVEILNDFMNRAYDNSIEQHWITNMRFQRNVRPPEEINTVDYLRGVQELETGLMRIQRPNGNTVKIEFTEEFMTNYRRSFSLGGTLWEFRGWAEESAPIRFGNRFDDPTVLHGRSWDLNLNFWDEWDVRLEYERNISRRVLAPYELIFLTARQLRVMRNAFFARHGFIFQSEDLRNMFSAVPRYEPNPNFHAGMLTDIDRANIAIIQRLEALVGD